ncbi:phosphotransferase family protein [Actinomadura scrupuli]|uniref:phosphotransferase family protein n=1 Tax=Actinomadura scrupuli TaxID=559629 RepID=UPI003D983E6C
MIDEIRALLARHLPGHEIRSVAKLGEGWDNLVYEVNGDLVVRRSKEADPADRAEATRREADLLGVLPEICTLPVPEPVFVDVEAGVLAYPKLPGLPLNEHPVAEPARLAAGLGEFLGRLHRAPAERMGALVPRDTDPLTTWRQDAEQTYRRIAGEIPAPGRGAVEDFLGRTPPAEPSALVFCHNDLGAEHLLADAGANTVTGVIDWTDAAIADPVHDLALIYRDLGPDVFDLTLAHYEGGCDDAGRERAAFYARCALLEDIAYGLETGARRYAEAGLAHLARTFA